MAGATGDVVPLETAIAWALQSLSMIVRLLCRIAFGSLGVSEERCS